MIQRDFIYVATAKEHISRCTHSNFIVNQLWFREYENYGSLINQTVEKHPSLMYGQVPFLCCPLFLCSGSTHTGSWHRGTGRGCRDSQLDNYCFQGCRVSLQCDDKHKGWHCWGLVQPSDPVRVCVLPLICMHCLSNTQSLLRMQSHTHLKYDLARPLCNL